jgi:uncharacterized protein (TIGR03000 family)
MAKRSFLWFGMVAAVLLLLVPLTASAQFRGGRGWGGGRGWEGGRGWGGGGMYYGRGYGSPGWYDGGYYGRGWGYGGRWGGYPGSYAYSYPMYGGSSYAYGSPGGYSTYQSLYPPQSASPGSYGAGQAVSSNVVTATFRLPTPDAELWVEGEKMSATGTTRQFVSPSLEPGRNYTYTFRARWTEDGRPKEQTKEVRVSPGDRINVTFGDKDDSEKRPSGAGSREGEGRP